MEMDCPMCEGVGEQHPDAGPCGYCIGTGKSFLNRAIDPAIVGMIHNAMILTNDCQDRGLSSKVRLSLNETLKLISVTKAPA